jgi:polyisoprenyl-phosphate glycosyltransferase
MSNSGSLTEASFPTADDKVRGLQGPILVLGASGFIGANLMRMLVARRHDVYGTATRAPAWRLENLPQDHVKVVDLLVDSNLDQLLDSIKPSTVFDCVAYGAYSFETDAALIYQTNFNLASRLLPRLHDRNIAMYVHAGSSSEYGENARLPAEDSFTAPNSDYAVSKVATANLIYYYGKKLHLPCANLRLYSVFGAMEDWSRLIPAVVRCGLERSYPEFVHPETSRDFVFIDDACEAFLDTALRLRPESYGESFNIGTGQKTTIGEIAQIAREIFGIETPPQFSMQGRQWDLSDWYADVSKAARVIQWFPRTDFREGLRRTAAWYSALPDKDRYRQASKQFGLDTRHSVSAIVACYMDDRAIPVMYERLKQTFMTLNVDYEIIFVNDCSPDDSEEIIRQITRDDRRVRGISHSRNFGSQSAFRSGMAIASKNAIVLLDGDLQDPPELIAEFVSHWRSGYDVAYGRRVKREASLWMQAAYKMFYRVFDRFSYVRIPHDAGDFSLLDRRVVEALLRFPERDLFIRGIRAYAGFRQIGVDYVRPERMFGTTTNSFWKNIGWAKKGILSFSYVPLTVLSVTGLVLFGITIATMFIQIAARVLFPSAVPKGLTTVLLAILFFGSLNLLALSIVGEYIAKIIEEVKRRPHFLRRSIIRDGEVRRAVLSDEKNEGAV